MPTKNYFTPQTDQNLFRCPCGQCSLRPKQELIDRLNTARELFGLPIHVTSGVRCPEYNSTLPNAAADSGHTEGEAADVACITGQTRKRLAKALDLAGFKRIGFYKHHLHVDISDNKPESWWVG